MGKDLFSLKMPENNRFRIFFIFLFLFLLLTAANVVHAADYIVDLYFFHGNGCPHCAEEKIFLDAMAEKYGDQFVVHGYELWDHPENAPILESFAAAFEFEPSGIPVTFIGNQYWVGFNEEKKAEIEAAIAKGFAEGVVDAQQIVDGVETVTPAVMEKETKITVPLIGQVDLSQQSLLVSTIIIGLVDGVNPCSLWVLTMLLAMIVHTNSRKKMVIIGLVFLSVSAAVYALFISGVFTLLSYISYMQWIQVAVAILTLILGAINLKDYFFYKEGVTLTIADDKKPGLYQKIRNVMNKSENLWAMIGATIVLALGVSLVEFSCTAAFPVVWSNLLVSNDASQSTFILLLLLYMLIYQLDELVIFGFALITMKSSRMQEKHGQILKLFSGCLMVILSLAMLINPAMMNNLSSTLLVFGTALLVTLVIYLLSDKILPKFGINIGHNRVKPAAKSKPHNKRKSN
jgi:cytochrome c biogenesis protein CcdA